MGSTNHGTQTVSHQYYEELTALKRNKRLLGILPKGIYSGGKLARVSDIEITLSVLIAEISGGTIQIAVRTAATATINDGTLDSGTIDSSTPYIVLRWAYAADVSNYMEIHAVATPSTNDIVVGKIEFSGSVITGFDYSERTFVNVQDLFLKPVASTGMYILVNAGKVHTSTGYVFVEMQEVGVFSVPSSPNSRIDLVYVDSSGSIQILQGTAAVSPVAPSYAGKLVIAEVTVVNGDVSISQSDIKDVRSFLSKVPPTIAFGSWASRLVDVVYTASTDGMVCATVKATDKACIQGYTDGNNPPTTLVTLGNDTYKYSSPNYPLYGGLTMPIRKGDYWKVTTTDSKGTPVATIKWLPMGS